MDAIIIIDEKGTIESLNVAAEKLFGYTPEEMIGKDVKMLMPAPYKAEHDGYLKNYTTTGRRKSSASGARGWDCARTADVPDGPRGERGAAGGRRLFTGIVRDITERKRQETKLIESEARMRAILAAAVDAIIIIDERGKIESLNAADRKALRLRLEEMVSRT